MGRIMARETWMVMVPALWCGPSMAGDDGIPVPQPRPQIEAPSGPAGGQRQAENPVPHKPGRRTAIGNGEDDQSARSECDGELREAGVAYNWLGQRQYATCQIDRTVQLLAVDGPGGKVSFPQKPVMNCHFAGLLGRWTRDIAGPVIASFTGARLASIETGPGVQCRNRNGDNSAKVSEHATGNAIDISKFDLSNGQSIAVGSLDSAAKSDALDGLQTAACGYFTTVLGPGANSAHRHHFHFDAGQHGMSGHYRICE